MYKIQAQFPRIGIKLNGKPIIVSTEYLDLHNNKIDEPIADLIKSMNIDPSKLFDSFKDNIVEFEGTPQQEADLGKIVGAIKNFKIVDGAIQGDNFHLSGLGLTTLGPLPFGEKVPDSEINKYK